MAKLLVKKLSLKLPVKVVLLFVVFLMFFVLAILNGCKIVPSVIFTGVLSSLWYWNCIFVGFVAVFYILKLHKFYFYDFLSAIFWAVIAFCNEGVNPILTPVMIFSYYAGCCIFRKYNLEKEFAIKIKDIFKSVGFGILIGIIPSLINVIEYYIRDGFKFSETNLNLVLSGAIRALQPGIFEEILFRFFLYAFVVNSLNGEPPKTRTAIMLTYALLILPHCWMHYFPVDFAISPLKTFLDLTYMCVVFGIPSVWLIKNKNLYAAFGFHWFIDFIRFCIVGH